MEQKYLHLTCMNGPEMGSVLNVSKCAVILRAPGSSERGREGRVRSIELYVVYL